MKKSSRLALSLAIVLTILIVTPLVFAALPTVKIGDTVQLTPFESRATAVEPGSRSTFTNPSSAYDGYIDGLYAGDYLGGDATPWGVTTFSKPSDTGKTDFTIGWVDIKILYACAASVAGDKYRWVYYVGAAGPFVLQDWTEGTAGASVIGTDTLARAWHDRSDGGDGSWTWAEITSVKVRVEMQENGDPFDDVDFKIYEIWLTVYPLPKPPTSSPTISVQPGKVEQLARLGKFFVDIYAKDMQDPAAPTHGLQILEFTLNFNATSLSVVSGNVYSYWPWTAQNWLTIDNTAGYVTASYGIPTANPMVDLGVVGSSPVFRIYFGVKIVPPTFSWLMFSVTKPIAPGGVYIPHSEYPGIYGTVVPGMHLMSGGTDITAPISTEWTEITPEPGRLWHLSSWDDNGDKKLSVSDTIAMTSPPLPVTYFHVASFYESDLGGGVTKHYMDIKETITPPEFPLGIGILMAIAPMVAIVYVWRLRKRSR